MSRPTPTWRALADRLGRALEGLGPDEAGAAVGVLDQLAARARAVRVEAAVVAFVAEHPGASSNYVVEHLDGDRSLLLRTLRDLERSGRLTFEPGPKGARLWFGRKDQSARINRSGASAKVGVA